LIVLLGFYPKPVLDVINPTSGVVMQHAGVVDPVVKAGK